MRPVASVQATGGDQDGPDVCHLTAGQSVVFGTCTCGSCGFDLVLSPRNAGRVVGRVTAHDDHCRLDNLSTSARLAVEDLEHPSHLVTVAAGRGGIPLPFELARVAVAGTSMVIVFGPEPAMMDAWPGPGTAGCPAGAVGGLDVEATYFAVLVALCAPWMCAGDRLPLPTSAEIAQTLAGRGVTLTARAVDAQIAYLVDKLGLRPGQPGAVARRTWRKEALATAAIRWGLVGPEHLARPRTLAWPVDAIGAADTAAG